MGIADGENATEMNESGESRPPNEQNPYAPPALSGDDALRPTSTSPWLIGCATLAAVAGAIIAAVRTKAWEIHEAKDITSAINNLTYGALVGLGLVLLCRVVVWREIRTMPPGYWFAINALPTAVAYLIAMPWDSFSTFEVYEVVHLNTQQVLRAALFIVIALTTQAGGTWKGYAWTRASFSVIVLLRSIIDFGAAATAGENLFRASTGVTLVGGFVQLSLPIVFLTAIVKDFYQGNWRNGVHWAGIGLHVAFELNHLINLFVGY